MAATISRKLRGFLQRYAPSTIKRIQWDREYSSGKWDILSDMPEDVVYPHVEKYSKNGSILDLGCGPGAVAMELKSYSTYTGVDISQIAVDRANERASNANLCHKAKFFQGDIESFSSDERYDVILLADALYYVPTANIMSVMDRLAKCLTPSGVFIMRTRDDLGKRKEMLAMISAEFEILEDHSYWEGKLSVMIFRP